MSLNRLKAKNRKVGCELFGKPISVWHLLMNLKNKYLLKKTVEMSR